MRLFSVRIIENYGGKSRGFFYFIPPPFLCKEVENYGKLHDDRSFLIMGT